MKKLILIIVLMSAFCQPIYSQEFYGVDISDTTKPVNEWKQNSLLSTLYSLEIKQSVIKKATFDDKANRFTFVSYSPMNHIFYEIAGHISERIGDASAYLYNYPKWLNDDEDLLNIYIQSESGSKTMVWHTDSLHVYLIWEGNEIFFTVDQKE